MSEMTHQPLERIERDVERDYFMTAEEALAYGIIDEIYQPREKVSESVLPSRQGRGEFAFMPVKSMFSEVQNAER